MVECRTPEREVRGSRPTAAVLCPWARHFTPRKYWLPRKRWLRPDMTEKLLTGTLSLNTTNQRSQTIVDSEWKCICFTAAQFNTYSWSLKRLHPSISTRSANACEIESRNRRVKTRNESCNHLSCSRKVSILGKDRPISRITGIAFEYYYMIIQFTDLNQICIVSG